MWRGSKVSSGRKIESDGWANGTSTCEAVAEGESGVVVEYPARRRRGKKVAPTEGAARRRETGRLAAAAAADARPIREEVVSEERMAANDEEWRTRKGRAGGKPGGRRLASRTAPFRQDNVEELKRARMTEQNPLMLGNPAFECSRPLGDERSPWLASKRGQKKKGGGGRARRQQGRPQRLARGRPDDCA